MALDAADRALLALLAEDARAPVAELGRALGLARTTVQSRIERLRRAGIIKGFTTRLSDEHERGQVRAHVMITVLSKLAPRVESELRRIAEVRTLHSVSGHFDLIAVVAAPSIGELDRLIDRIGALEGVERTQSSIVLSTRIER